jgi:hypothetical protein
MGYGSLDSKVDWINLSDARLRADGSSMLLEIPQCLRTFGNKNFIEAQCVHAGAAV